MLLASVAYPFSYKLPSPACLQSFSRWTGNCDVPRCEMAHCEVARLENSRWPRERESERGQNMTTVMSWSDNTEEEWWMKSVVTCGVICLWKVRIKHD
jgi:hypothetical protein